MFTGNLETCTEDCESTPNQEGQGGALPPSDRETCPRSREGLVTQAVVADSARDMSVGADDQRSSPVAKCSSKDSKKLV